jgi:hypothetical protein
MKRNYILAVAICFLFAAFFIFSSTHVRVERKSSPDYSKKINQDFKWKKEDYFSMPPFDANFFSRFTR